MLVPFCTHQIKNWNIVKSSRKWLPDFTFLRLYVPFFKFQSNQFDKLSLGVCIVLFLFYWQPYQKHSSCNIVILLYGIVFEMILSKLTTACFFVLFISICNGIMSANLTSEGQREAEREGKISFNYTIHVYVYVSVMVTVPLTVTVTMFWWVQSI